MEFHITAIKLWFSRMAIIILILVSILNYLDNRQQDKLIFGTIDNVSEILKQQIETTNQISYIMKDKIDIWTVLNRMAEDYPPKN